MSTRISSGARRATSGGALFTLLAATAVVGLPLTAMQQPGPTTSRLASGGSAAAADVHTRLDSLKVPATAAGKASVDAAPVGSARLMAAPATDKVVAELPETATDPYGVVGVTWQGGYQADGLNVQVRTRVDGAWSGWQHLDIDDDGPSAGPGIRGGTSPTWVGHADGVGVRLISTDGTAPEDVRVATIDGGTGLAEPAGEATVGTTDDGQTVTFTQASASARPRIITRHGWGVDRSYESHCDTPHFGSQTKGIVLHHTVTSNSYTRAEAPGIVRSIHRYHTQSRNWCDIGYNFLVDKYGKIYEGRRGGIARQVRAAHAGNWTMNTYTTGISMMGNFDQAQLSTAMKNAIVRLAAWKLSASGHNAKGKYTIAGHRIPRIIGHRDIYLSGIRPATATACPGKNGHAWLPALRNRAQARIDGVKPSAPAPDPRPTTSRMAGDDRYATAAAISKASFTATGGDVFLASGEVFPDALSAGPAAARKKGPVLLAQHDGLPTETITELKRLKPSTIHVLGGRGALSTTVVNQAKKYAASVSRVSGANRYATGVNITKKFWSSSRTVYVASGASFPDALSGGVLAAHNGAPILLTRPGALPTSVATELKTLKPTSVVLLGDTGAVSSGVTNQVKAAVPGVSVSRLAGADRYATSAAAVKSGWSSAAKVYFATGADFPDALAGVPAAAKDGAPLLLTRTSCLPGSVFDRVTALDPNAQVLLGDSSVLTSGAPSKRC